MSRPKTLLLAIALAAMSLTALTAPAGASAAAPSAKKCKRGKTAVRAPKTGAICVRTPRNAARTRPRPRAQASVYRTDGLWYAGGQFSYERRYPAAGTYPGYYRASNGTAFYYDQWTEVHQGGLTTLYPYFYSNGYRWVHWGDYQCMGLHNGVYGSSSDSCFWYPAGRR
jgi:hypothetical protein